MIIKNKRSLSKLSVCVDNTHRETCRVFKRGPCTKYKYWCCALLHACARAKVNRKRGYGGLGRGPVVSKPLVPRAASRIFVSKVHSETLIYSLSDCLRDKILPRNKSMLSCVSYTLYTNWRTAALYLNEPRAQARRIQFLRELQARKKTKRVARCAPISPSTLV